MAIVEKKVNGMIFPNEPNTRYIFESSNENAITDGIFFNNENNQWENKTADGTETLHGLNVLNENAPYVYYKETFENYEAGANLIEANPNVWSYHSYNDTADIHTIVLDENTNTKYLKLITYDQLNTTNNQVVANRSQFKFNYPVSANTTIEFDYKPRAGDETDANDLLDIWVVGTEGINSSWYRVWINYGSATSRGISGILPPTAGGPADNPVYKINKDGIASIYYTDESKWYHIKINVYIGCIELKIWDPSIETEETGGICRYYSGEITKELESSSRYIKFTYGPMNGYTAGTKHIAYLDNIEIYRRTKEEWEIDTFQYNENTWMWDILYKNGTMSSVPGYNLDTSKYTFFRDQFTDMSGWTSNPYNFTNTETELTFTTNNELTIEIDNTMNYHSTKKNILKSTKKIFGNRTIEFDYISNGSDLLEIDIFSYGGQLIRAYIGHSINSDYNRLEIQPLFRGEDNFNYKSGMTAKDYTHVVSIKDLSIAAGLKYHVQIILENSTITYNVTDITNNKLYSAQYATLVYNKNTNDVLPFSSIINTFAPINMVNGNNGIQAVQITKIQDFKVYRELETATNNATQEQIDELTQEIENIKDGSTTVDRAYGAMEAEGLQQGYTVPLEQGGTGIRAQSLDELREALGVNEDTLSIKTESINLYPGDFILSQTIDNTDFYVSVDENISSAYNIKDTDQIFYRIAHTDNFSALARYTKFASHILSITYGGQVGANENQSYYKIIIGVPTGRFNDFIPSSCQLDMTILRKGGF